MFTTNWQTKKTFLIFCDFFFHTSATEVFQAHENRKVVYLVIFLLPLLFLYLASYKKKLLLLLYIIPIVK